MKHKKSSLVVVDIFPIHKICHFLKLGKVSTGQIREGGDTSLYIIVALYFNSIMIGWFKLGKSKLIIQKF